MALKNLSGWYRPTPEGVHQEWAEVSAEEGVASGRMGGTRPGAGLGGDCICPNCGARILAAVDAYDAMTSDRPYRKAMSPQHAGAALEKGKGKQFDPVIVDAFLEVIGRDKRYKSPSRAFTVPR